MNENAARPTAFARPMSSRDFAVWGMEDVAYVRAIDVDGKPGWAICAANGTGLGMAETRDIAFAAARQNDLEPLSVH